MKAKSQNELLNAVKGVACIAVVFMHCEFPGLFGVGVQAISRFCVPFFFMISGYYCFYASGIVPDEKMYAKWKHVAKVTLYSTLFYLAVAYVGGKSFHVTTEDFFNWSLFNVPCIIVGQLWFLFALLYDYILFAAINKFRLQRIALRILPIAFLAYFLLAQGFHILGVKVPNMYYRNWMIEGFAFFMAGYWIHQNQQKLQYRNTTLLAVFSISTFLCLLERYIMGRDFGVNICSVPQVVTLFLLAMNNPTDRETKMSLLGKRYSMFVYILHPFVWNVLKLMYTRMNWNDSLFAAYAMPILVVAGTLLFSHIVYMGNQKLTFYKSK